MVPAAKPVTFFGEMSLDITRRLPDLWADVCQISKENGYMVDIESDTISLFEEKDSMLYVTKIMPGREGRPKKIIKLVFESTKARLVEEYEMVGADGSLPIWKRVSL